MEVLFSKMWLKSLIKEEINKDQLKSTAKAINKRENDLEKWVKETDPTSNQGFSVWLLRGLKKQWIRMEDGPRAKRVLERFIQLRRVNRIGDIMQYPHINDLENAVESLTGVGAKRQGFSGVNPETLPGVQKISEKHGITFYKVSNPTSLGEIGEGTKWCTRKSYGLGGLGEWSMAKNYINRYGYLIVGYKDGKPYVQFNPDYSQIMDVNDVRFKPTDPDELKVFPKPKQPEKYNLTLGGTESKDVVGMRNWSKLTGVPLNLPNIDPDFWKKFEPRLAKSILKANSYGGILNTMRGWKKMFTILNKRTPEVEKAILQKDWSKVSMKYFSGGGKMRHIPGMYEITEYVKDVIKGNWPEFEKKIKDDMFNSVYYYTKTGLDPIYVDNPTTRDLVIFSKLIKNKDPLLSSDVFQSAMKSLILKVKKELNVGEMKQFLNLVLRPYLKCSGKTVRDILGNQYDKKFYKMKEQNNES